MASTLLKNIPAEDFIVPPHKRAVDFSADKRIPVIDLAAHNRTDLAQQIIKSAKEFGVFQVRNVYICSAYIFIWFLICDAF